jgi:hypothetical protein
MWSVEHLGLFEGVQAFEDIGEDGRQPDGKVEDCSCLISGNQMAAEM